MMSGLQQLTEFRRGMFAVLCGLLGLVGLLARAVAPVEDAEATLGFLFFAAALWPLGKGSFKLGWARICGAAAALCGVAVGIVRSALGP